MSITIKSDEKSNKVILLLKKDPEYPLLKSVSKDTPPTNVNVGIIGQHQTPTSPKSDVKTVTTSTRPEFPETNKDNSSPKPTTLKIVSLDNIPKRNNDKTVASLKWLEFALNLPIKGVSSEVDFKVLISRNRGSRYLKDCRPDLFEELDPDGNKDIRTGKNKNIKVDKDKLLMRHTKLLLDWLCSICGNRWSANIAERTRNVHSACPDCVNLGTRAALRHGQNTAINIFRDNGFDLIEPYRGSHEYHHCICLTCKRETLIRMTCFSTNKRKCTKCLMEALANTMRHPQEEAERIYCEHKLRLIERYINNSTHHRVICMICGRHDTKRLDNLNALGCKHCIASRTMSIGALHVLKYLDERKIDYALEQSIDFINELRYDFYLPDMKTFIEFDGDQHFVVCSKFKMTPEILATRQETDRLKTHSVLCIGHNIIRLYRDKEHLVVKYLDKCFEYIRSSKGPKLFVDDAKKYGYIINNPLSEKSYGRIPGNFRIIKGDLKEHTISIEPKL